MLTLWGRRSALNVQKVAWLIGELELAHRQIEVGGVFGGLEDPDFQAKNPHGRVPVIEDGDTIVWESHSILRYLAARYGGAALWPAHAGARSLPDRWMDWSQTSLQPDFMALFWGFYRTPAPQRDWRAIRGAKARLEAHYRLLDRELTARNHLAGADFTLADVPAGATLYRYFQLEIDRPLLPGLEAWYRRLTRRPAYQTHVMQPFHELLGRLDY
ncbi:MAG: glutathione S-transferase [Kiloniellales bacterium]|nr:glutathione S-transferase [Kiloniellales bacterium]